QVADDYLRRPHEMPVYDAMLVERGVKFQYPLSSLLFTRHLNINALNVISWWSVAVTIVATWLILWRSGARTAFEFRLTDVMVGLGVMALALTFYPLIKAYALGQI